MRPPGEITKVRNDTECVTIKGTDRLTIDDARHGVGEVEFKYDHIFGQESTQGDVYDEACKPLVDAVMRGYVVLFCGSVLEVLYAWFICMCASLRVGFPDHVAPIESFYTRAE